jgi:two-component system sensor histidine kinase VicK
MIKVEVRDLRGSVLTRISDNGVGIPSEHLGKIFDRFFRVRRPGGQAGTGLGLSIAKKIIDSHGGRIWAESENGQGTTFSFTLPKSKSMPRNEPLGNPTQSNQEPERRKTLTLKKEEG